MSAHTPKATLPRRRIHSDVAAGGVTLVLGIALSIAASGIRASSFGNSVLQPRDLPFACGVGLTIAGVVILVQGLLKTRAAGAERLVEIPDGEVADSVGDGHTPEAQRTPPPVEVEAPNSGESPRKLLVLAGLLLGYTLTLIPLGYIAATLIFLLGGTMFFSPDRPRRNVIFAVLFSVGVYYLFTQVLGIVLPEGILEFLP